jgi:hypothetical protein
MYLSAETEVGRIRFFLTGNKGGIIMMSGISGMSGMMGGMRPDPQQMFNRLDSDGSASVDKDELSAMAEEVADRTGNEIDVDSLMESYDGDGDGVLSQEEAESAMESIKEQMGPPPEGGGPKGPPHGGGGMAGGEEESTGLYGADGTEEQSLVDQLLGSLAEASDEEEQEEIVQEWIQTLKGENQSYSPVDTIV